VKQNFWREIRRLAPQSSPATLKRRAPCSTAPLHPSPPPARGPSVRDPLLCFPGLDTKHFSVGFISISLPPQLVQTVQLRCYAVGYTVPVTLLGPLLLLEALRLRTHLLQAHPIWTCYGYVIVALCSLGPTFPLPLLQPWRLLPLFKTVKEIHVWG
jgi:hypothetical protein